MVLTLGKLSLENLKCTQKRLLFNACVHLVPAFHQLRFTLCHQGMLSLEQVTCFRPMILNLWIVIPWGFK